MQDKKDSVVALDEDLGLGRQLAGFIVPVGVCVWNTGQQRPAQRQLQPVGDNTGFEVLHRVCIKSCKAKHITLVDGNNDTSICYLTYSD